jgi:hypothetical protein
MAGFGDLFGGLTDLIGGLVEAGAGRAAEEAVKSSLEGRGPGGEAGAPATVERYLTGAKRALNINDI